MRRRALLLGAALLLLGSATVAALLGRDLQTWQDAMRAGDAAAAAGGGSRRAGTVLPFGAARGLLGLGDDLAFRQTLALYRLGYTGIPSRDESTEGVDARGRAELALARLIHGERDRRRASQAANLLGVLMFLDSQAQAVAEPVPIDRAVSSFVNAILLDPGNDQAKANLELALAVEGPRTSFGTGNRSHTGHGRGGASLSSPGQGY